MRGHPCANGASHCGTTHGNMSRMHTWSYRHCAASTSACTSSCRKMCSSSSSSNNSRISINRPSSRRINECPRTYDLAYKEKTISSVCYCMYVCYFTCDAEASVMRCAAKRPVAVGPTPKKNRGRVGPRPRGANRTANATRAASATHKPPDH